MKYEPIPMEAEHWGKALLDAAFEVHTILGAGFLERVYEDALCYSKRASAVLCSDPSCPLCPSW